MVSKTNAFITTDKLETFPFDVGLLSSKSAGRFPDLSIRLNPPNADLSGGELIELKSSKGYSVSSFNSTIPSGKKAIGDVLSGDNSQVRSQMVQAGDDVDSLQWRDVFYLVRGQKRSQTKVCLVHGSFFETVRVEELVQRVFSQVLDEQLIESDIEFSDAQRKLLARLFSKQRTFSQTRNVAEASVTLRFRVMTEAKVEADILNPQKYPKILDNTLNLIVPLHQHDDEARYIRFVQSALAPETHKRLSIFQITHLLNGPFLVFQSTL
ncbi:MAG: hypothetical protein SF123_01800 [Chloroflexota bacterium]|nr:hypothetical protein [Chloroflexota bacterium]